MLTKTRSQLKKIPKATLSDTIDFWKNYVEDLNFVKKEAIIYAHMDPNEIGKMNLDDWNEIMSAQSRDERPQSLGKFIAQSLKGKEANFGGK